MYQGAGSRPGGVLAGLSSKSPFAKGLAMQTSAGLGMENAGRNLDFAMQQRQDSSQMRQQQARNFAQNATNAAQERTARGALSARKGAFDTDMAYGYARQNKGRRLQMQQSVLNQLAGDY